MSGFANSLIVGLALVVSLTGCTDGEDNLPEMVVRGDCSYQGVSEVSAGSVTMVLQTTSLGHLTLSALKLAAGRDYSEVVAYYEATDTIPEPPAWTEEVAFLELRHEGGEGVGESRSFEVVEGQYALVCIDHQGYAGAGPTALPVAEISVSDS
ncbi:MAG TPA: hypothetical protein VMO52_06260 [Acidimicrobiia bacterium]|nr:hypothetical protein [Acidimicrobiia bacterium]